MRAITIRHPYSYAIIQRNWGKLVENRSRNIAGNYRGPVAIHQAVHEAHVTDQTDVDLIAAGLDQERWLTLAQHRAWTARGEVIGVADLVDVHYVDGHSERWDAEAERNTTCSPWAHHGPIWHLVFANPRPLTYPIPVRGQLGLWTLPDDIEQAVRGQL